MDDEKTTESFGTERRVDPQSSRRAEGEVVLARDVVAGDVGPAGDQEVDRRRRERRKIDRMSTGI